MENSIALILPVIYLYILPFNDHKISEVELSHSSQSSLTLSHGQSFNETHAYNVTFQPIEIPTIIPIIILIPVLAPFLLLLGYLLIELIQDFHESRMERSDDDEINKNIEIEYKYNVRYI